jgi:Zn-dependent protease
MNASPDFVVGAIVTSLLPMILSLGFHEWGHAVVAVALGDPTPREQGRLTINPVAHMSVLGTLILPAALVLSGLPPIGWAKPVEYFPHRFTRKITMTTGVMLTAAAGPLMNLLIAVMAALLLATSDLNSALFGHFTRPMVELLSRIELMNVMLFVFNLLPVPPLDGSRVLVGLLPSNLRTEYERLFHYSGLFLCALLIVGGRVILQPTVALLNGITHVAGAIVP